MPSFLQILVVFHARDKFSSLDFSSFSSSAPHIFLVQCCQGTDGTGLREEYILKILINLFLVGEPELNI